MTGGPTIKVWLDVYERTAIRVYVGRAARDSDCEQARPFNRALARGAISLAS